MLIFGVLAGIHGNKYVLTIIDDVLDFFGVFECLLKPKHNLFYKDFLILLKDNLIQKSKLFNQIMAWNLS